MNPEIVSLLARHAMTAFGAIFASKLNIDQPTLDAVVGSVATIAGIAWSIKDKSSRKKNEEGMKNDN